MKVHRGTILQRLIKPSIAIGVFDGVHRGHAAIFSKVKERASEMEGESAIVTFWPHPRIVFGKNIDELRFLTSLDEKISLIRQSGIDHLFVIPFTKDFAQLSPCRFVKMYLVDRVGIRHLVFGFDHHFGYKREGNYENLKSCAELYSFSIEQLEPVMDKSLSISSTIIRNALKQGDVKLANRLLSYHYSLEGAIVGGNRIGRGIGFPTANIDISDKNKLIPADGVYAVKVTVEEIDFMGMMNIGFKPTVNSVRGDKSMEVHIIDFDGDIYSKNVRISFIERIREERHFGSVDKLKEQLITDKKMVVHILSQNY